MSIRPVNPVNAIFTNISGVYDLLNHVLSLGIDKRWRRHLASLAETSANGVILDLAAGTLDVAMACHQASPLARILAVDFCMPMLLRGQGKIADQRRFIQPCGGDALAIPARSNCVDSITMAFGIRNIADRSGAFAEMLRVLRGGGKACILEFGSAQEKIWGGLYNIYLMKLLPLIGKIVSRNEMAYQYLARTISEFPPAPALAAEMERAGFQNVGWRKLTSGIVCLHWGIKPN